MGGVQWVQCDLRIFVQDVFKYHQTGGSVVQHRDALRLSDSRFAVALAVALQR